PFPFARADPDASMTTAIAARASRYFFMDCIPPLRVFWFGLSYEPVRYQSAFAPRQHAARRRCRFWAKARAAVARSRRRGARHRAYTALPHPHGARTHVELLHLCNSAREAVWRSRAGVA